MCYVSAVMDQYRPHIPPQPWRPGETYTPPQVPSERSGIAVIQQPIVDLDRLEELIESFREAVKAAEAFDRITGQPNCVDLEKQQLEDRVAELEEQLRQVREAAG